MGSLSTCRDIYQKFIDFCQSYIKINNISNKTKQSNDTLRTKFKKKNEITKNCKTVKWHDMGTWGQRRNLKNLKSNSLVKNGPYIVLLSYFVEHWNWINKSYNSINHLFKELFVESSINLRFWTTLLQFRRHISINV